MELRQLLANSTTRRDSAELLRRDLKQWRYDCTQMTTVMTRSLLLASTHASSMMPECKIPCKQ